MTKRLHNMIVVLSRIITATVMSVACMAENINMAIVLVCAGWLLFSLAADVNFFGK